MPAAVVVYEIERYISRHVPPGWHGALREERGDDGQIINPQVTIHRGW